MRNENKTSTGARKAVKELLEQNDDYMANYDLITWDEGVKILKESEVVDVELIDEPLVDGLYLILRRPTGEIIAFLIEPVESDDMGIPAPIHAGVYTLQEGKGCTDQS